MVFRKQREQERQSRQGRIEGYPLTWFPPFSSRMKGVRTSERVWGLVKYTTCPYVHTNKPLHIRSSNHSQTHKHASALRSVCYKRCLLSFLVCVCVCACVCLWWETLRLALCGPDYNRISAAIYYTGLWTISDTVDHPELWGLKTSFNYTSAERKSTVTNSHKPLFTQCGEITTRQR